MNKSSISLNLAVAFTIFTSFESRASGALPRPPECDRLFAADIIVLGVDLHRDRMQIDEKYKIYRDPTEPADKRERALEDVYVNVRFSVLRMMGFRRLHPGTTECILSMDPEGEPVRTRDLDEAIEGLRNELEKYRSWRKDRVGDPGRWTKNPPSDPSASLL